MSPAILETEHQELFYPQAELHKPIPVHIPSALAKLGYYVCLRVPANQAERLGSVRTHLEVAGLRPDDVTLDAGEGTDGQTSVASAQEGPVWALLCRAYVSRGDGTLTFSGVPEDLPRADVLLCTWLRFLTSGEADAWLACQDDPAWAPGGVPLGGIGTGKVEVSRDGRFRNYSGNNNQDMPFEHPDGLDGAFLSVAQGDEERLLASRSMGGLAACERLEADLLFPQVRLAAADALPGVDASVLLSGPVVPHDLVTASLPGFLVRWQVHNRKGESVTVRCRLGWPNLVGTGGGIGEPETRVGYADGSYRFWEAPDAHRVKPVTTDSWCGLQYGNAPSDVCAAADGYHYVAAAGADVALQEDPRHGSVARTLTVAPGATATADMAVVWELPRFIDNLDVDRGLYWQNRFANGEEILARLFQDADRIFSETAGLADLFAATDAPTWLRDRLVNCCYPLVTNSVLYKDGRFSINEGPTEMTGCYGTLDQRLGAHPATHLFFPELDRTELELFGAVQAENGGVNHDLGHGHLEEEPRDRPWPDLACSFIIQNAKHAWATGDQDFEDTAWERSKKALFRHAEWSDAGGGVAQVGQGLGTSYDGYHYEGTTPYMATLWLAALEICRTWARARGEEAEFGPRIDAWHKAAIDRLENDLWNGSFYRAYGSPNGPKNENAHAGMLAGQAFCRRLCGENVLSPERLEACTRTLLALNGSDRFAAPPDEVTPEGEAATEYSWLPYVESFGLSALAGQDAAGMLPVWERTVRTAGQQGRRPCDTRLMYRPTTGEASWGSYYMTAPASWLVYEALLDLFFRPAEGVLRLAPALGGAFAVVHPHFWGVGRRDGARVRLEVRRVFVDRALQVTILEVPEAHGAVSLEGETLAHTGAFGDYARFRLPEAVAFEPGAALAWTVERPPQEASSS